MFALEGKHKKWKNVDKECYILDSRKRDEDTTSRIAANP